MLSAGPSMSRSAHRLKPRSAVCLLVLCATLHWAFAAAIEYHIDSWTTENGLPQNVVGPICQTRDGYLWLATRDGMARFDGVRFVVFNRSNTPGIQGNRFISLYCTPNGEFWAGSEFSGVTRYSQGEFTTYTERDGLPANEIPEIIGDDAGHIWALSQTAVVQWNGVGFQLTDLPSEESKCNYFPMGRSGFWCIDGDSLHLFARGELLRYPLPDAWPRQAPGRAGRDWSGVIWLATADCRLARLNDGRWTKIYPAPKSETSPRWGDQTSTYRDARGNRWRISVGCDSAGLLLQGLNVPWRGQIQRIGFNTLLEDREGSIWLSSDGQGLYRVRRQTVTTLSKDDGLPDRNIYPIYQDRQGTIWIGTWNGGLARFNDGKFKAVSITDGLTSKQIYSIFEDRKGVLWVSTSGGLYKRHLRYFQRVRVSIPGGAMSTQAIHQDAEGALWFGTNHGLLRLKDGTWSRLTTKDGLATDDVRVMIDGHSGNVWIGGYGGLTSLDHGQFKRWTETDGLPSNSIRSLYEDKDGILWIGTYDGGLGRLKDGRFTRITARDGLFNNGVFQILEDARGYLWMSCNRGIYRVSRGELNEFAAGKRAVVSSTVYGKSEGIRNAECNGGLQPAGIRARDGRLWFPTQDGVAVVDPEAVTTNPVPPPVVIESISLDHKPQALGRPTRVPPGRESLEIEYTALSFINSDHIRFRYKLEGLDSGWEEANTRRTAYYSHLRPGKYLFRVIAANSDNVWNTEGQTASITVLPPFYQTWWFLMLTVAGGLGISVLTWHLRVSQLKRGQAMQQAFCRELIASQEDERKRIAAELHDSLGQQLVVIRNLALIALRDATPQPAFRSHMEEISVTAAQTLSEVRKISYNLRPYQLDRLGLTKAITGILNQVSTATTIAFTGEIDQVDDLFPKESEINFYRIVQECINNVVKHSKATRATLSIRRVADELILMIEDNGHGFRSGASGSDSEGGGFGLIGVSERAQLLRGKVAIHSEPGQGTTVSVRVPLLRGDKHGQ